jgi:tetratricopeptide (TPR) repeat protein
VDLTGAAGSDEATKKARVGRLVLLGQVLAQAKRDGEAVEVFGQALKLDPNMHVARLARAAIDLRQQRFEPAARAAREVIAAQPRLAQAHELLIAVLMAANKREEARAAADAYVAAMSAIAQKAEAVAMRAKVALELGDVRAARADLLHALELRPDLLPAFDLALDVERKRASYEAAASLGATLAQKAGTSGAYLHLAAFHNKNGKSDAAGKCLRRAVELREGDVGAWRMLAAHLVAHGSRDEAMAALARVVALAPRREDGYRELAKLQTEAGQIEAARGTYRKWLSINPHSAGALNNLAMLYADASAKADLDQGVAVAERARVEAPTAAAVNDTLGWLLVRRGNKAELRRAIMLLESAVAVENVPEIYYHLGAAQAASGNREAAAAALRKATQPGAKYPGLVEAQRLLKQVAP